VNSDPRPLPTFRAANLNTSRHLAEFWMIPPEIVFANLSDNAALAEGLMKYTFAALLNERQEDLALFDQRTEKRLVAELKGIVGSEFAHMDYREAIHVLEVGHRPAVGARALSGRKIRQEAGNRDELPEGHQSLLHAAERRRPDGHGDGRAGTGDRRDHRWQPARGSARSIGPQHDRARNRRGALRLVPQSAPLRHVPHAGFGLGFERTFAYVTGLANVWNAIRSRELPETRDIDRDSTA
jgi:asparaginyl-tRNA synthetase